MNNNVLTRILSLTLCLCLMLGLVPAFVPVAAEAVPTRNAGDQIIIEMHDSYGDGWGGNAINVLENGVQIDSATIDGGKENTWTYTMKPDCEYAFVWVKGAWSSECFFEIYIAGVPVFSATTTDCNLFADGKVLYPLCQHTVCDAVVTPATCKKDGYTTYTCTTCGFSYEGDVTPATGHSYGDDDFCDNCGFDINSIQVEISMTDARALGLQPPIRESGHVAGSPGAVLRSETAEITIDSGVIVAQRHLHLTPEDALRFSVEDRQVVRLQVYTQRPLIFQDVLVRVRPDFATRAHLDFDEANACGLQPGDVGRILS